MNLLSFKAFWPFFQGKFIDNIHECSRRFIKMLFPVDKPISGHAVLLKVLSISFIATGLFSKGLREKIDIVLGEWPMPYYILKTCYEALERKRQAGRSTLPALYGSHW